MTLVPDHRPKVTIEDYNAPCTPPGSKFEIVCEHCGFIYLAAVKTDAEDQARWHRQAHRREAEKAGA